MNTFKRALLSASQQVTVLAPDAALNRWSVVSRYAAVATLAMAGAGAHAWNDPAKDGPLPERQAQRWGENIGGAIGRIVGSSAITNPSNSAGRAVQSAVIGIAEDVGRWAGGVAATKPYEKNPVDQANAANRVPPAERDHLDTLGLRAIFASEELLRTPRDSRQYRAAADNLYNAQRNFEMAYRGAAERRVDVQPWAELREVLQTAHRGASEQRLAELGAPLVQRLNRPDGPGYDTQGSQANPLAQLRQQAGGRSAPPVPWN